MNDRARLPVTIMLAFILIGQGHSLLSRPPAAANPGTGKLASLLLANSFREADRLAAQLPKKAFLSAVLRSG